MLRSVEQRFQYSIHELDKYGYTILSDETTTCGEPYSIRQIHASKTRPRTSPIEDVVISGRMRNDECIALHRAGFGPSGDREMHTWFLEAEGPIQVVSLYENPFGYPMPVRNLTLAFLSREQTTRQNIYRISSYHYADDQFRLDPYSSNRGRSTAKGVVREIHVPKTIALEPWIGYFLDTDGHILKDPNHPWQDWFRKLGAGYAQKSVNRQPLKIYLEPGRLDKEAFAT